jgi:hypothetical protein
MGRLNYFLHRHPFDFLPAQYWPGFFWSLLGLTIVLMIIFGISGASLTTTAAPYGVVSFELAGTVKRSLLILRSWDADMQLRAAFGLGLDYLFMLVYASTIAIGCGLAAQILKRTGWPLSGWGNVFSWAVILAAILDSIENLALTTLILGSVVSPWPEIARWCAIIKFSLIFIGIVYVIYGGVVAFVVRISPPEEE